MSIAFDSFWWWRAEFDGQYNPDQSSTATVTSDNFTRPAPVSQRENFSNEPDPSMTLGGNSDDFFSSYGDFANWHWPAALSFEDYQMSTEPLY